jgi:opacity protein-like surface antigen
VGFAVFKRLLVATCVAFVFAPAAQAANHGWYWGIEAGIDRMSADSIYGSLRSFQGSLAALATIGNYVAPQWRVEGELGYRNDSASYGSGWDEFSLMANVLYDIPIAQSFTGTIGAGVGGDMVSDGGVQFAYQLIAGAAWSFSEHTDLTLQYRYLSASGPETGSFPYSDLDHQTLTLGLRFAF